MNEENSTNVKDDEYDYVDTLLSFYFWCWIVKLKRSNQFEDTIEERENIKSTILIIIILVKLKNAVSICSQIRNNQTQFLDELFSSNSILKKKTSIFVLKA